MLILRRGRFIPLSTAALRAPPSFVASPISALASGLQRNPRLSQRNQIILSRVAPAGRRFLPPRHRQARLGVEVLRDVPERILFESIIFPKPLVKFSRSIGPRRKLPYKHRRRPCPSRLRLRLEEGVRPLHAQLPDSPVFFSPISFLGLVANWISAAARMTRIGARETCPHYLGLFLRQLWEVGPRMLSCWFPECFPQAAVLVVIPTGERGDLPASGG